ncbi:hypothetical protein ABH941_007988, partial [Streptacidiphilus sp. EB103A]
SMSHDPSLHPEQQPVTSPTEPITSYENLV